jgi:hypothetical protein
MAAIEDIIGWCKEEQARLAHQLEQLQSGQLRTYEKHAQAPGWLEIDTTAQSIELCRQYISEMSAIIARYPQIVVPTPQPAPPPRMVPPVPQPVQHRPLAPDPQRPGWVNGWAVVKGQRGKWLVTGIYDTRLEAEAEAANAGEGYYVRWGGYNAQTKDFLSGPTPTT